MTVRPTFQTLLAWLVLSSAGCGSENADGHVMVGLTTDLAVGFDIHRIESTTKIDGIITHSESLSYGKGDLSLPAELLVEPARDGAPVELMVAAFRDGEASPIVTRRAATHVVSGRKLFLPVSLDEACMGATCMASATCQQGVCVDPFIAPSALEDYDPKWIASAPDACKTPLSGDPTLVIGQGESGFAPLGDSEVVPIEPGAQGGHHVWLALRLTGLRQMGSQMTMGGYFPDLAYELPAFTVGVTLRKAGGGECEIYGVTFQVDRGIPVDTVRGQALDIEVMLEDPNGHAVASMKRVVIAP